MQTLKEVEERMRVSMTRNRSGGKILLVAYIRFSPPARCLVCCTPLDDGKTRL